MIPVLRLLHRIDSKLNKVASLQNQYIPDEEKILAINEGQQRILKKKIEKNNQYQLGFDSFRSRYEQLQNFVVQYEEVSPTKTKEILSSYEIDLTKLKNQYYLPIDTIYLANKGKCKNREIYLKKIVPHSDITTWIKNSLYNPNFAHQETIAVISGDKLITYTDEFEITKVLFSYLRFPKPVDIEGYIHLDGTESINQDCELGEELEDELLALSIECLAYSIGDYNIAQAVMNAAKESE